MKRPFTLFTPGPVMMEDFVRRIGSEQLPYFRTADFSETILRCESLLLSLLKAPAGFRVVTLTGSGTAAMEAAVINGFGAAEEILALNGGGFGERWGEICRHHRRPCHELKIEPGSAVAPRDLEPFASRHLAGFLVTHHETTTGQLHDLAPIYDFCRRHNMLLVVDAISSFLADPISLTETPADILILSSQKGMMLPPGLSFLVLSPRMIERIGRNRSPSYYLDLNRYLRDLDRGQTPFTPAIGVIRQMEAMLQRLSREGVEKRVARVARIAADFRKKIRHLPFSLFARTPSNAVTALEPKNGRPPSWYVDRLREKSLYVCPNGGELGDRIFRVGHLGALQPKDNTRLVRAIQMVSR